MIAVSSKWRSAPCSMRLIRVTPEEESRTMTVRKLKTPAYSKRSVKSLRSEARRAVKVKAERKLKRLHPAAKPAKTDKKPSSLFSSKVNRVLQPAEKPFKPEVPRQVPTKFADPSARYSSRSNENAPPPHIDYAKMCGYEPSRYQVAVFDHIRNPKAGNARVVAVAGSGKTTTLVSAIKLVPQNRRVLFAAFNRHIAESLSQKVSGPNISVSTLHSLGMRVYTSIYNRSQVKGEKVENILYFDVCNGNDRSDVDHTKKRNLNFRCKRFVIKMVSLLKNYTVTPDDDVSESWRELAERHNVDYPEKVDEADLDMLVTKTFLASCNRKGTIDFDDMIFMPVLLDLPFPKYDDIFIDESQDLNRVQIEFLRRLLAPDGRIITVGDPKQGIYGFRGADTRAMDTLAEMFHTKDLPLSICYRCPKAIVVEAQKLVPYIEASPTAKDGTVSTITDTEFDGVVKQDDMVLCRTTAPLVQGALKLIAKGIKAVVRGRDGIGDGLIDFVKTVAAANGHADLTEAMHDYEFRIGDKLRRTGKDMQLAELQDRIETIKALLLVKLDPVVEREMEAYTGIQQDTRRVIAAINKVFSDDNIPAVRFSTIHGAKGLEAQRVFIIHPELLPHPKAHPGWEADQELNLKYVAVTRALDSLFWVEGAGEPEAQPLDAASYAERHKRWADAAQPQKEVVE